MDELQRITTYLRSLGEAPPTPAARADVAAAIQHKWQGVQATAARVLARWGDRPSIDMLKDWLVYGFQRQRWSAIRRVAFQCLAQCAQAEDVDWMIDLMLLQPEWLRKHEFVPVLVALPPHPTRERLRTLRHDPDWRNREIAIMTIARRTDPERSTWLHEALLDEHPSIRAGARFAVLPHAAG